MIEELGNGAYLVPERKYGKICVPKNALTCPRYERENHEIQAKYENTKHVRFPCSHKRELGPEDFHFENVSPQIHHVAVPLC